MTRLQTPRGDTEALGSWQATSLDEMIRALEEIADDARREGHSAAEVYCEKRLVMLVSQRLTDGSHVLNVHFLDGE